MVILHTGAKARLLRQFLLCPNIYVLIYVFLFLLVFLQPLFVFQLGHYIRFIFNEMFRKVILSPRFILR